MLKKGFRRVPVRQCLNKAVPLKHPVVAAKALIFFFPMDTEDREITRLTPPQSTS